MKHLHRILGLDTVTEEEEAFADAQKAIFLMKSTPTHTPPYTLFKTLFSGDDDVHKTTDTDRHICRKVSEKKVISPL